MSYATGIKIQAISNRHANKYLSENYSCGVCGGFAAAHTVKENPFPDRFYVHPLRVLCVLYAMSEEHRMEFVSLEQEAKGGSIEGTRPVTPLLFADPPLSVRRTN